MSSPYSIPSFVLVAIVGGIGLFGLQAHKSLKAHAASLADITAESDDVAQNISIRKQALTVVTESASPVNSFMAEWSAHFAPGKDGNAILSDFSRIGNEQTVSVQGRKSGLNETMWHGVPVGVQVAQGTAVSSEYYRLLNWLGAVERAWPLARVDTFSFEQNGASLSLFVKLSHPSFIVDKLNK